MTTLAGDSIEVTLGGRAILRSAFVDVVPGLVTALIGRSGAGKTTLLRVLEGTLTPATGTVRWGGAPVRSPRLPRLARLGVVSLPSGRWLPGHLSVRTIGRMVAETWRTAPDAVASEFAAKMSLDSAVAVLSGGEQRIAELAVALAADPVVLLLDEPFRGLAPTVRDRVGARLRRLAIGGVAVLFAEHDVTAVLEYADRVYSLEAGRTRLIPDFRTRPVPEWYAMWPGC